MTLTELYLKVKPMADAKINSANMQQQVHDLGIMSEWTDIASTMEIVKLHDSGRPMNIIEFGAGNGGWPVMVSKTCKVLPHVYAWESFQHVYYDFSITTDSVYRNLARDKQELMELIDTRIPQHHIQVIDQYVNYSYDLLDNDTTVYDIIRLDCLDSYFEIKQLMERVVKMLAPGGLFLLDDIVPGICVNRFRAAMNYDDSGELSLLWVGTKECAFQKPGGRPIDQQQLKTILQDKYDFKPEISCPDYNMPNKTYVRHCR